MRAVPASIAAGCAVIALAAAPAARAQDFDGWQSQFLLYKGYAETDVNNLGTYAQNGNLTALCVTYTSAWSDLGHEADVLESVRDAIQNGATPNAFFSGVTYDDLNATIDDLRDQQQNANDGFEENCSD